MREFTNKEKELIVNTPITIDTFEIEGVNRLIWLPPLDNNDLGDTIGYYFEQIIKSCETCRRLYLHTGDEMYFNALVRLLPNSYKVVKL